jgi:hypothetical protein
VTDAKAVIARRLRWQAAWCERLGSPLYARLLEAATADVERGGPAWSLLEGHEEDPPRSALALRMLGAVHRLVLEGRAPELAALYPSAGGSVDLDAAPPRFLAALERHHDELRVQLMRPVQTNEVSRCKALLGGFLLVAQETGLPLTVLEVGASAGLNLLFDRYAYSSGAASWGEADSPVRFEDVFSDRAPSPGARLEVGERRGCDLSPLDPRSPDDRLTLTSFVWPDQRERHALLASALSLAQKTAVTVERADAADWAEQQLATARPGAATVLFHSIVLQYLSARTASRLHGAIEEAGARATPEAPFAWLSVEPGAEQTDVRLRLWPGGEERLLAHAGYHDSPVQWLGAAGAA